jgi:plasmid rolling circle replication initiator protein Rep
VTSLPNLSAASKPERKKDNPKHSRGCENATSGVPRVSESARDSKRSKGADDGRDSVLLGAVSPRDRFWDVRKADADLIARLYGMLKEFLKYSEMIYECARWLEFEIIPNHNTGECSFRLRSARFCRKKWCPVCIWRRRLLLLARFLKRVEADDFPKGRWALITFTVENVPLEQLRATLDEMDEALRKMIRHKGWQALGWIKSTEVTRAKNNLCHPHTHLLLYLPHSYFSRRNRYINKRGWSEMFGNALGADYLPIVNVRIFKEKRIKKNGEIIILGPVEIFKYAVKGCDLIGTKKKPGLIRKGKRKDAEWFAEFTRQMHRYHLIAAGGILKSVFKEEKENNNDLLRPGETTSEEIEELKRCCWFLWRQYKQRYCHRPSSRVNE